MLTNKYNIKPIYKYNEKGEQIRIRIGEWEEEEMEVFITKPKVVGISESVREAIKDHIKNKHKRPNFNRIYK